MLQQLYDWISLRKRDAAECLSMGVLEQTTCINRQPAAIDLLLPSD